MAVGLGPPRARAGAGIAAPAHGRRGQGTLAPSRERRASSRGAPVSITHQNIIQKRHTFGVASLAWSPDGTLIASGGTRQISIRDVRSGKTRFTYRSQTLAVAGWRGRRTADAWRAAAMAARLKS